jgi:hypothetical protein
MVMLTVYKYTFFVKQTHPSTTPVVTGEGGEVAVIQLFDAQNLKASDSIL